MRLAWLSDYCLNACFEVLGMLVVRGARMVCATVVLGLASTGWILKKTEMAMATIRAGIDPVARPAALKRGDCS